MAIRILRLGTPRTDGEGPRIGTVRRPPRGVPKAEFGSRGDYDTWYPELAASVETMKLGKQAETAAQWAALVKAYRHATAEPAAALSIALLAALSHHGRFSVGCYCEHEASCHRSVLRALLHEQGADIAD